MAEMTIIVGAQGVGKSTLIRNLVDRMASVNRKSLIIDPGAAQAYQGIPFISQDDIPAFREFHEGSRIARISEVLNKKRLIATIFGFDFESDRIRKDQAWLNGTLVLEDAKSYINSRMTEALVEAIKSFKQNGISLMACYHSIGEISADLLELQPHHIYLKKTGDEHVLSEIKKARKLKGFMRLQHAFYLSKFAGMDVKDIQEDLPPDCLKQIYKDWIKGEAKTEVEMAKALCKKANGRLKLSAAMKTEGKYHWEYINLRN